MKEEKNMYFNFEDKRVFEFKVFTFPKEWIFFYRIQLLWLTSFLIKFQTLLGTSLTFLLREALQRRDS